MFQKVPRFVRFYRRMLPIHTDFLYLVIKMPWVKIASISFLRFAWHTPSVPICIVDWTTFFIVNCIVTAAPNHRDNNYEYLLKSRLKVFSSKLFREAWQASEQNLQKWPHPARSWSCHARLPVTWRSGHQFPGALIIDGFLCLPHWPIWFIRFHKSRANSFWLRCMGLSHL